TALAVAEIQAAARPVLLFDRLGSDAVLDVAAKGLHVKVRIGERREVDAEIAADRCGLELPGCGQCCRGDADVSGYGFKVRARYRAEGHQGVAADRIALHGAVRTGDADIATYGLELRVVAVMRGQVHVAAH